MEDVARGEGLRFVLRIGCERRDWVCLTLNIYSIGNGEASVVDIDKI